MAFTLPPLPYAYEALEPHIDARTMQIHHDKHHAAYVNNLNAALANHPELGRPRASRSCWPTWTRSGGQSARRAQQRRRSRQPHAVLERSMGPNGGGGPAANWRRRSTPRSAASTHFKEQFAEAGMGRFGSGWAWLSARYDGQAEHRQHPQPGQPLCRWARRRSSASTSGSTPTISSTRTGAPTTSTAWWNVVNWDYVERVYVSAHASVAAAKAVTWAKNKWTEIGDKLFGRG